MNSAPASIDALDYLQKHEQKDLLRFLTAGSVDDGKSTLIGRLLHDSNNVFEDQSAALERDSARVGNAGEGRIDYALLLDGLAAEREQGITIDVAYRYFTTPNRKFIIADTPGHEQYTRNMATGASTADCSVILIDARKGVLPQTKRHSYIASLLGIRRLIVAINKMDLADYAQARYEEIVAQYQAEVAAKLPPMEVEFIPLSALEGDNVVNRSENMTWYEGPTMLEHLEQVPIERNADQSALFYPVQYVLRPNLDFRGFSGTVASGVIRKGQPILALPSGKTSTVERIVTADGDLDEAFPPQSVTVTLDDEIDISRGDVIVHPDAQPYVGTTFEAMVVWMTEEPLEIGKSYWVKLHNSQVAGTVRAIRHAVDVNSLEQHDVETLELNTIARVVVELSRTVVYDLYANCRQAGALIFIDRQSNITVGAGMVAKHLSVESNQVRNLLAGRDDENITGAARGARFNQRPATVWLAGERAADVARLVERELFGEGYLPYILDCANLSVDIRRILGFEEADATEGLRRAVALSRLCKDVGVVAIGLLPTADDQEAGSLVVHIDSDATPAADATVPTPSEGGAALSIEGDDEAAAASIVAALREQKIIGYFPGSDMVSI